MTCNFVTGYLPVIVKIMPGMVWYSDRLEDLTSPRLHHPLSCYSHQVQA